MKRLILRLRWLIVAPILRPILKEWEEVAANASRAAKMKGAPREWQIECIARSEVTHVHAMEIEEAFGCASFDKQHRRVRNYS
jgi:hypothetical protein